ncbi:MAG: ADP-ribosylglycohydrolase family protein, partial [uncultured Rubrobacteraceae bacterium]
EGGELEDDPRRTNRGGRLPLHGRPDRGGRERGGQGRTPLGALQSRGQRLLGRTPAGRRGGRGGRGIVQAPRTPRDQGQGLRGRLTGGGTLGLPQKRLFPGGVFVGGQSRRGRGHHGGHLRAAGGG